MHTSTHVTHPLPKPSHPPQNPSHPLFEACVFGAYVLAACPGIPGALRVGGLDLTTEVLVGIGGGNRLVARAAQQVDVRARVDATTEGVALVSGFAHRVRHAGARGAGVIELVDGVGLAGLVVAELVDLLHAEGDGHQERREQELHHHGEAVVCESGWGGEM